MWVGSFDFGQQETAKKHTSKHMVMPYEKKKHNTLATA